MDKTKLVAVLMGGPGSEREVSLASGRAVLEALLGEGVNAVGVDVTSAELELPAEVSLAVNVIHGTFGEDGTLQGILEQRGIPYTGAGAVSSRLAFDKVESKKRFVEAGVPTPASEIIDCSRSVCLPSIALPYVVKPPREGSSVGVSIVQDVAQAQVAIKQAVQYGDEVLIEQFIEGKELTVGVLGDEVFPIVHIVPRDGFYDIENKYPWMTGDGGTDYYCPADLSDEATKAVQEAALSAHRALEIEVYSRVDVLLTEDGVPYVLEANTIPGMTESSLLPKAAKEAGYSFGALCLKVAELSLETQR